MHSQPNDKVHTIVTVQCLTLWHFEVGTHCTVPLCHRHACRELLEDSNFHSAVQRVVEEPVPYFTQFGSCPKPSGATKESAHQHPYAARLDDVSSEGHPALPHPHTPPASLSQNVLYGDEGTPTVQAELHVDAQMGSVASIQEEVPTDTADLDATIKQYVCSQPHFTPFYLNFS